jgi:hypothetical protein
MEPKTPPWKVRDKRKFLAAAMELLAGSANISFEGDLSSTKLLTLPGASENETVVLKRNTLWPKQSFVALQLQPDQIASVLAAIGGTLPRGIIHILIEKDGHLELGLYDNFQHMVFGPKFDLTNLDRLVAEGLIKPITNVKGNRRNPN